MRRAHPEWRAVPARLPQRDWQTQDGARLLASMIASAWQTQCGVTPLIQIVRIDRGNQAALWCVRMPDLVGGLYVGNRADA